MEKFRAIFKENETSLFIETYSIIPISSSAGFLEFLSDTLPIDDLKKKYQIPLDQIYRKIFEENFEEA